MDRVCDTRRNGYLCYWCSFSRGARSHLSLAHVYTIVGMRDKWKENTFTTLIVEDVNCQNVHERKNRSMEHRKEICWRSYIIYWISSSIRVVNESHLKMKLEILLLYTSMHISSNCCPILLILWMTPDLLTIIYPRLLYIMEVVLKWTGIRRRWNYSYVPPYCGSNQISRKKRNSG